MEQEPEADKPVIEDVRELASVLSAFDANPSIQRQLASGERNVAEEFIMRANNPDMFTPRSLDFKRNRYPEQH
jgi:hypothetical protein